LAKMLGYEDSWLEGIPETAIESFAGTGNPFMLGPIAPGEHVIDVGSGAGIDSLIAAKMAGPTGQILGVDMTPEMLERARRAAREADLDNVTFEQAYAESIPVPDGWADVVISNGVLNLMPDKSAALQEIARVLRPGGRLQVGDILVEKAVPESAKADISLWTGWIAGALLEAELQMDVEAAGFKNFHIVWRGDVFKDAPQQSSAANCGTIGITFGATRAD
jgi:arsenite methyltransferase